MALVLVHHKGADIITAKYGEANATTVRGKFDGEKFSNNFTTPRSVTLSYAFFQFIGIACHLLPGTRAMDFGFNSLLGIQSSAFLMTLFRKGLIRWYSHVFWYLVALVLSGSFVIYMQGAWFWLRVATAFHLRINHRMSKYLIWTLYVIVSLPIVENFIFQHFDTYKNVAFDHVNSSGFNNFQNIPGFSSSKIGV